MAEDKTKNVGTAGTPSSGGNANENETETNDSSTNEEGGVNTTESTGEGSGTAESSDKGSDFFSTESILMFAVAGVLDVLGLVLFLLGTWFAVDDYGILDATGFIVIGGWMISRSGGLSKDLVKKSLQRFITASTIEVIPFLGGAAPSWTWLVYKTIKGK